MGINVILDYRFEKLSYPSEKMEQVKEIIERVLIKIYVTQLTGHRLLYGDCFLRPFHREMKLKSTYTAPKIIEIVFDIAFEGIFDSTRYQIDRKVLEDNVGNCHIDTYSNEARKYNLVMSETYGLDELVNYDKNNSESLGNQISKRIRQIQINLEL